ncbi:olfactory receptor 6M1-like [Rhinatrema bivittatum]|uniref:olfactory receptor 6M1-like n=1 Tax=Rhinatrema bivittatum TaxID=194408 RepID=UPI00112EDEFC|nr:olfactory receptor 6M1-like [Rhinatrema bivittatum]
MKSENITSVREFIFLGFTGSLRIQSLLFLIFLVVYIITCLGNVVIITITRSDYRLHTPMYFFISNLSFLDLWYTSSTSPKMLANFLSERKTISFIGCITQLYFCLSLGVTENFLLAAMAYDRYVAICNPLRYAVLMSKRVCIQLVIGCWFTGFLSIVMPATFIAMLPYCASNVINQIFCDISPLIQLSCSDTHILEKLNFITAIIVILGTFFMITVSYIRIVSTILRISSSAGRKKAFSTCASHLMVVLFYYGPIIFMYIRPNADSSLDLDKVMAVFCCIVTPMLNPIIYSFRNKEVKHALIKVISRKRMFSLNEAVR